MDCEFCNGQGFYVFRNFNEECPMCEGSGNQADCVHCKQVHAEECADA